MKYKNLVHDFHAMFNYSTCKCMYNMDPLCTHDWYMLFSVCITAPYKVQKYICANEI